MRTHNSLTPSPFVPAPQPGNLQRRPRVPSLVANTGRRTTHVSLVLGVALWLVGCTSAPAGPPASPSSTATAAPTDTARPTATAGSSTAPEPTDDPTDDPTDPPHTGASVEITGRAPAILASDLGDYSYGLVAAYFMDGSTHHAYVVGFGDVRGEQRTAHLSSPDGSAWRTTADDPFRDIGIEFSPPGPIPTSVLRLPDGSWAMYLWGIEAPLTDGADIFLATSDSASGPWVSTGEPILQVGPRGSWDDRAIDFPSVVPVSDGYRMIYSGVAFADPNASLIGLASSEDGVTWTKEPEPIIEPGMCGDPESRVAAMPRLIDRGGSYLLLYDSDRRTVAATSSDLRSWTCVGDSFVLQPGDIPPTSAGSSQGIHSFAAANEGDEIHLLIESLVEAGSDIWRGRFSTDP